MSTLTNQTRPTSPWTLAVDIGSAVTRAAAARGGKPETLDSVTGQRFLSIPSAVAVADDGEVVVGHEALRHFADAPERAERSPKPFIGEDRLLLGTRPIAVSDLVTALLQRALTKVQQSVGADLPAEVRLTHPAGWGPARTGVLSAAGDRLGLRGVRLVPEPVAAAERMARTLVHEGQLLAVYDLGATKLATAVLRRSAGGFEMVGPPGGRQGLGGDDIDQRIARLIGEGGAGRRAGWSKLWTPRDDEWRRHSEVFMAEIRRAKQALCDLSAVELTVPGLEMEVQLTRDELVELSQPVVEESLLALEETLADAGVGASELATVLLVGGSSRIPSIADAIWARFQVRPEVETRGEEGAAAVLGAASALGGTAARGLVMGDEMDGWRFQSQIAAVPDTTFWKRGVHCFAYLNLAGEGVAVAVRDEPARGLDVAVCAADSEQQLIDARCGYVDMGVVPANVFGRPGGLERRFQLSGPDGPEPWLERYVHDQGRWFVVRAPERAREVANGLALEPLDRFGPLHRYVFRVTATVPSGWEVSERLELIRNETGVRVTTQSYSLRSGTSDADWINQQISVLDSHRGYLREAVTYGSFLGGQAADMVTYRTDAGDDVRVWLGVVAGRGYRGLIALAGTDVRLPGVLSIHNRAAAHIVLRGQTDCLPALTVRPTFKRLRDLPNRLSQLNFAPQFQG